MSRPYFNYFRDVTLLARELRKNSTPAEGILWNVLKGKKLGYRFLRQHPLFYRVDKNWKEFFIADFYCRELRLVIEVDGLIHDFHENYDKERDEKLLSKGLQVIRIRNEDLGNIDSVLARINQKIKAISPGKKVRKRFMNNS